MLVNLAKSAITRGGAEVPSWAAGRGRSRGLGPSWLAVAILRVLQVAKKGQLQSRETRCNRDASKRPYAVGGSCRALSGAGDSRRGPRDGRLWVAGLGRTWVAGLGRSVTGGKAAQHLVSCESRDDGPRTDDPSSRRRGPARRTQSLRNTTTRVPRVKPRRRLTS